MKTMSLFAAAALLMAPVASHGQDAAMEERLNKLSAQIEDLVAAKEAQNKRIEELAKAIREVQDQTSRPNGSYASAEDVKQLTGKLQEIDRKRQDDNEHILKELEKLGASLRTAPKSPKTSPPVTPDPGSSGGTAVPQKGFEYEIKDGNTLSAIAKAYSEQGKKVTVEQILKANPGLDPAKMKVGQKIFIPAATP